MRSSIWFKATIIGVLVILLAACAPVSVPTQATSTSVPAGTAPTQAPAAEKVTIEFWTWEDLGPAVEKFKQQYPNIDVNVVTMGPWDLHDKVLTSLAAGVGLPDVVELTGRRYDAYMRTGKMLDITDRAAKYEDQYSPPSWSAVKYGGKIYALPYDYMPGVIHYRTDIFKKYDIDPKSLVTWDDFIAAGKKISADGKTYMMPVYVPSTQWGVNNFVMYLESRGGQIYNEDGTVIQNNKLASDTFQWYYDLANKEKIALPIEFFTPEYWAAFNADKFATWPMNPAEGASLRGNVESQKGKWGVLPWPLWSKDGPKSTGIWGGAVFAGMSNTKHPDEAFKFIEFLSASTDGAVANWASSFGYPALIPAQQEIKAKELNHQEYYDPSAGTFTDAFEARQVPLLRRFNWAQTEVTIGRHIDAMFSGQETPTAAWATVEQELAQIK